MGRALAQAAVDLGHDVVVVSGPVDVTYPEAATVRAVVTTDELLAACAETFPHCDGLIAAAAPCDYRPVRVARDKMSKTGAPIELRLVETPDVVATLAAAKTHQWIVGFALETEDPRYRALVKLERKQCDLMVSNGPKAMHAIDNEVELIDPSGAVVGAFAGPKEVVAAEILAVIQQRLVVASRGTPTWTASRRRV
jgi:phosphopantothenoylcysteine decarboxylase/phosphopantothenate--cysteine ligase